MKRLILILFLIPSLAFGAYTEFYCDAANGNNLWAGSSTSTSPYTKTAGNWVQSTRVYTVRAYSNGDCYIHSYGYGHRYANTYSERHGYRVIYSMCLSANTDADKYAHLDTISNVHSDSNTLLGRRRSLLQPL